MKYDVLNINLWFGHAPRECFITPRPNALCRASRRVVARHPTYRDKLGQRPHHGERADQGRLPFDLADVGLTGFQPRSEAKCDQAQRTFAKLIDPLYGHAGYEDQQNSPPTKQLPPFAPSLPDIVEDSAKQHAEFLRLVQIKPFPPFPARYAVL